MREIMKENLENILKVLYYVSDILVILGIVFLAFYGKDGWGWLMFYLIVKNY